MLDLWQQNTGVAARPQAGEGHDLPATFGDTFDAAWHEGQLFSSSIANYNARMSALNEYTADIKRRTGKDLDLNAEGGADLWAQANDQVRSLKLENPDLDIAPLSDDEITRRTAARAGEAHRAFTEMSAREKTLGGKLGMFTGGLASGSVDPLNVVGLAVAPEAELGVLGTAAMWGGYGAVSQSVNEVANAQFRQQAQPGYDEAAGNILESGVGGAALGGLFKGLGNVWSRMKTGEWPRSVRDAGNIVESEANIQGSNVLPGAEGEAVHREALGKTIDDILAGRSIDVPNVRGEDISAPIDAIMKERTSAQTGGVTADQIHQQEDFKNWFSGSRAIDDSGKPLALFHGTSLRPKEEFEQFDAGMRGEATGAASAREAFFFSEDRDLARSYAESSNVYEEYSHLRMINKVTGGLYEKGNEAILNLFGRSAKREGKIVTAHVSAKNPLEVDLKGKDYREESFYDTIRRAKEAGHDSVVFRNAVDPGFVDDPEIGGDLPSNIWAVFEPEQIKIRSFDKAGDLPRQGELPFEKTAKAAKVEAHTSAITDGLERIGVSKDEAAALAKRILSAKSDDEARSILNEAAARPETIYETVPSSTAVAKAERQGKTEITPKVTDEDRSAAFSDVNHQTAQMTELERLRDSGEGGLIPIGVDEKGEPKFQLLDQAIQDAKNDQEAALQIEACINPPAEAAE